MTTEICKNPTCSTPFCQGCTPAEFGIKVRKRGTKAWWFLSSNGGMNRLRIHAVRFSDQLKAGVNQAVIEAGNPEYEAKVVLL